MGSNVTTCKFRMHLWTYLEKAGLHILQLLVLQLYLAPFMFFVHISSKELS
jgi:hypothetical protein